MTSVSLDLPPGLLDSVCMIETHHKTNVIHYHDGDGNSIGICQIKLKTAKWLGFEGSEKDLMEPQVNIYYAGKYLQYHIDRYDGDIEQAIIAYNMGHTNGLTHTNYSAKVIKQWRGI